MLKAIAKEKERIKVACEAHRLAATCKASGYSYEVREYEDGTLSIVFIDNNSWDAAPDYEVLCSFATWNGNALTEEQYDCYEAADAPLFVEELINSGDEVSAIVHQAMRTGKRLF